MSDNLPVSGAQALQRQYYTRTAASYDEHQVHEGSEHRIALALLAAFIEQRGYASVLDVGSGTGRALHYLKRIDGLLVRGVEPVAELREQCYQNGLTRADLVCCFGVLHHIEDHKRAVAQMCRVARHGVFISDANNFGQGRPAVRALKQLLRSLRLWPLFDYVRTGGKGHHCSEGDGVFYSYSIFDDLPVISARFPDLYWSSTRPSGPNFYRSAQTIALFATGKPPAAAEVSPSP